MNTLHPWEVTRRDQKNAYNKGVEMAKRTELSLDEAWELAREVGRVASYRQAFLDGYTAELDGEAEEA
jgi:hypothetical protein